jgi:2-aminobenzoylacetyl-CoA thioesterase
MWIKSSGEITDHTLQITTSVSSHMLIQGEECAMIDASIWPVREYLWKSVQEEVETIEYIFITHAHFDHVGAIPYLLSEAPHIALVSGRSTANLLKDQEVLRALYDKNKASSEASESSFSISFEDWSKAFKVDVILSDGESLSLGDGVEVVLIETPGHSSDSVSYYIKPDLVFCAGDAAGSFGGRDLVTPSFDESFESYIQSIQRISSFDIQVLSFPHGGSLTGELISKYLTDLFVISEQNREIFKRRLAAGEFIDDIANSVALEWIGEGRFPDGPFKNTLSESVYGMIRASR